MRLLKSQHYWRIKTGWGLWKGIDERLLLLYCFCSSIGVLSWWNRSRGPANDFDETSMTVRRMGLKDLISLASLLLAGLKRACNQSSRSNFGATHGRLAKTHPLKKGTELMGHIKAASWPDRPDVFTQPCPPPFPAVIMLHAGKSCLGHYQHKARCILGDSSQAFITAREVATKAGGSEVPRWRDLGRGICRDLQSATSKVCGARGTGLEISNLVKRETLMAQIHYSMAYAEHVAWLS